MVAESHESKRRILFLTPQMPYPPEQGTALLNINLITQIATQHDVALLTFAEPGSEPMQTGPLSEICSPLQVIPAPTRTMRHRLRTLLLSDKPDMAQRLASPAYADALRHLLSNHSFDIVQVEGIEMAPYGLLIRQWLGQRSPPILFDAHNAEYLLQSAPTRQIFAILRAGRGRSTPSSSGSVSNDSNARSVVVPMPWPPSPPMMPVRCAAWCPLSISSPYPTASISNDTIRACPIRCLSIGRLCSLRARWTIAPMWMPCSGSTGRCGRKCAKGCPPRVSMSWARALIGVSPSAARSIGSSYRLCARHSALFWWRRRLCRAATHGRRHPPEGARSHGGRRSPGQHAARSRGHRPGS